MPYGAGQGIAGSFEAWWARDNDPAQFIQNGIVALDASTLLHMYRVTPATRDQVLNLFRELRERIWIPHQAALEFHRNRTSVVTVRTTQFRETRRILEQAGSNAAAELQKAVDRLVTLRQANMTRRDWEPRTHGLTVEDFKRTLRGVMDPALLELRELEAEHDLGPADMQDQDLVLTALDQITRGRIGPTYNQNQVAELVRETVEFRYPNRIPPGYEDAAKKSTPYLAAGDYILWRQLIDFASQNLHRRPVTLITVDAKEDWWVLDRRSRPERARPELRQEFYDNTSCKLMLMTLSDFLAAVESHLPGRVSPETVEEVRSSEVKVDTADKLEEIFGSDPRALPEKPDLLALPISKFESLIILLLQAMQIGDVVRIANSGLDMVLVYHRNSDDVTLVETKKYSGIVGTQPIFAMMGAMEAAGANRGKFITTSRFGNHARINAASIGIELIEGQDLLRLLQIYLGVDAAISADRLAEDPDIPY
ncbi:PIN-like domain-containing protein [Micromonospora sp. NPDC047670]|uniref:PIN-like domain-containing protein n=1 Tax=Micromonospora sp. NPDC047670 TaxID=3364252 RepID=UPI0037159EF8